MATLKLSSVKKSYGKTAVIHGIDCEVSDGEFLVIVGASGCGKSTLLRMIAGLESISDGEVAIDDTIVNDIGPDKRNIAMVFQNYALYPHMTVYANMAYGLKIRGYSKQEIDTRVNKAADMLELQPEQLKRKPSELSGGQRQRVAMGRAIVREPSIFLFDEPLSNLDAKLRVQMRVQIKALQQSLGITAVYVTHDQVEAMTLGDRLMVLNDGLVEQIGPPSELYIKPKTKFVAGFIGSPAMNFIDAHIKQRDDCFWIESNDDLYWKIQNPDSENLYSNIDTQVCIGIRPEDLQITDADDIGVLRLKVAVVEHLGADSILYCHLPNSQELLTVRASGYLQYKRGDSVALRLNGEHLHLFSKQTQQRLN